VKRRLPPHPGMGASYSNPRTARDPGSARMPRADQQERLSIGHAVADEEDLRAFLPSSNAPSPRRYHSSPTANSLRRSRMSGAAIIGVTSVLPSAPRRTMWTSAGSTKLSRIGLWVVRITWRGRLPHRRWSFGEAASRCRGAAPSGGHFLAPRSRGHPECRCKRAPERRAATWHHPTLGRTGS